MEINIYLVRASLASIVPKLLEKIYTMGERCVFRLQSTEEVEVWSKSLWTYSPKSFLPHGDKRDDYADKQPIWLTDTDENPNSSSVCMVLNGSSAVPMSGYTKGIEVIEINDQNGIIVARKRIKEYTTQGIMLKIWQQTSEGKWDSVLPTSDSILKGD